MFSRFRKTALADQSGQAMTEFALISFSLLTGGMLAWWGIIPAVVEAYNIHIHGYYLVLGLPFP